MTHSDIEEQIRDFYGVEVSFGTITAVTNRVLEDVKHWQQRPLERQYLMVWIDRIVFKTRHEDSLPT